MTRTTKRRPAPTPVPGHHVAKAHMAAYFRRTLAIDPDLAPLDQLGGKRSRLNEPRAPQPFVEPLTFHLIASVTLRAPRGKIAAKLGEHGKRRRVGRARALLALKSRPLLALARGLCLPGAPARFAFCLVGFRFPRLVSLAWTPDLVEGDVWLSCGLVRRSRHFRAIAVRRRLDGAHLRRLERLPFAPETERLQDRGEILA